MNDTERVALMRRQAQRLQDDGAQNAADTMRDGADRIEKLAGGAAPPHADAGPQNESFVPLADGRRIAVREYGATPRESILAQDSAPFLTPKFR